MPSIDEEIWARRIIPEQPQLLTKGEDLRRSPRGGVSRRAASRSVRIALLPRYVGEIASLVHRHIVEDHYIPLLARCGTAGVPVLSIGSENQQRVPQLQLGCRSGEIEPICSRREPRNTCSYG